MLIDDPTRFDGVKVLGVDEHVRRHTKTGDKYVIVIADLTLVKNGTGTALLLDMIPGRSKAVFKTWLAERDEAWKTLLKWSRWTGSPASKPQPLKNFLNLLRFWILFMRSS